MFGKCVKRKNYIELKSDEWKTKKLERKKNGDMIECYSYHSLWMPIKLAANTAILCALQTCFRVLGFSINFPRCDVEKALFITVFNVT